MSVRLSRRAFSNSYHTSIPRNDRLPRHGEPHHKFCTYTRSKHALDRVLCRTQSICSQRTHGPHRGSFRILNTCNHSTRACQSGISNSFGPSFAFCTRLRDVESTLPHPVNHLLARPFTIGMALRTIVAPRQPHIGTDILTALAFWIYEHNLIDLAGS